MRVTITILLATACAACTTTTTPMSGETMTTTAAANEPIAIPTYPETRRVDTVDMQAGIEVADPYRWLENDVREDEEVAAWVAAQNAVTRQVLDALPGREWLEDKARALLNYERFGLPTEEAGHYFYTRNDGLQDQDVLYVRDGIDGSPRVLIDPNGWSEDGTKALASWDVTKDGSKLVYAIQESGSDWRTFRVLDVASGQLLDDEVKWGSLAGLSWDKEGEGFFYVAQPAPQEGEAYQAVMRDMSVRYHKLGTDQSEDAILYADPANPFHFHSSGLSEDGRYLVVFTFDGKSPGNQLRLIDLESEKREAIAIHTDFQTRVTPIEVIGSTAYLKTTADAPNERIVTLDLDNIEEGIKPLIDEQEQRLASASVVGNMLFASYLVDAKTEVRLFDLSGNAVGKVALPGLGVASGFGGGPGDKETFFAYSSFNQPSTIYRYDLTDGSISAWASPELQFDPDMIDIEQRFYSSKDGTRVPMFIVKRKDVTGPAPTLLYGYGGFDAVMSPNYSSSRMTWIEAGGVFVLANIRGGGEYGKAWHDGGRRFNKQNVFDDFIAAGEALIAAGDTTSDQLAIMGGSNGGLLVGAVLNQRPDLFAAAIPQVGVMDMTRFHKFTAGKYWINDYGDPDTREDLEYILTYSPYHNVDASKTYPAVLVTTADTDDRVVPGHSFKYAAALQQAAKESEGDGPQLIRIETSAGHGSGKPISKIVEEVADQMAFIAYYTGLELPEE